MDGFTQTRTYLMVPTLILVLHGCGFALRGSGQLPASLQHIYIDANRSAATLVRELDRQLQVSGATPAIDEVASSSVLKILENDTGQRILSVTTTGGPEEYEVFHIVRYEVEMNRKRVFGPQSLTLTRDYTYDKNDILGKRQEFATLSEVLRQDMASLILRRLALATELQ